jgi:magnesium chelatase subunit I
MSKSYTALKAKELLAIQTLGELKAAGYQSRSVKEELRANLIAKLKKGEQVFAGIHGYEDSVIPELERAILSRHNINLLGLRGQAKTRLARLMVALLDEYVPVVAGAELNDDPLAPLSPFAQALVKEQGDATPITWMHREERYTEKLATPDVSVADLIGDVDPIKAASLKLPYSDPRVIHFGLIPRSHRGIFVINELPDLQARIQVALFNILQEGDIQIRGFKLRLPLDIQFVFTANPEDYTNRGSIVTPLKDRIDSQIITHYPKELSVGRKITAQEARVHAEQKDIYVPELAKDLIEQIAFEARESEYIDAKSGVSARLTISAYENMLSAAERRMLINDEKRGAVRLGDLFAAIPAITGKVELVYEGEQEGAGIVAYTMVGKAIRKQFTGYFPEPESTRKQKVKNIYKDILAWFAEGHELMLLHDAPGKAYQEALKKVPSLKAIVDEHIHSNKAEERWFFMEFVLHGLAEYSQLSRKPMEAGLRFNDLFSSMFDLSGEDFDEEDES